MKSSDIKVGGIYAYEDNPRSGYQNPMRVEVLEVGVPRQLSANTYWKARRKEPTDGIRAKVVDPRYSSFEIRVRPEQIVSEWAVVEAEQEREVERKAERSRRKDAAAKANRPVLDAVRAAILERGLDHSRWDTVMNDDDIWGDEFVANSLRVSVSLSLAELAQLLGVEGKVVSPDEVEVKT